ncbi:MAG: hypothetical protein ACE5F1_20305, partial [Planctomycetota bacterium]
PNASFWDWRFIEEQHGQGDFKDSIPSLDEVEQFITQDLIPKLAAALRGLDSVLPTFNFKIELEGGLVYGQAGGPNQPLWIDIGDVSMLKTGLRLLMAKLRTLTAYEWNNVNPNDFDRVDFPQRDGLDWIEKNYPILGTIKVQQRLLDARKDVMDAWLNYKAASDHIRKETQEESDNGLLTLGRGNMARLTPDFLASEAAFKAWAQEIVDHFVIDTALAITKKPDGKPLPPEDQVAINFLRLWTGVDLRTVFFKTILNPLVGYKTLGVTGLAGLTPDMYQAGGVVAKIQGVVPGPGDLQRERGPFPRYAVRIASLPPDPKIIPDGSFSDWTSSNSVQIAAAPQTGATPIGMVDQGRIHAAFDAKLKAFYLRIDSNAAGYFGQVGDFFRASFWSGLGNNAWIGEWFGAGQASSRSGNFGTPVMATSAQGIEIAVPLLSLPSAGTWVEVAYEIRVRNSSYLISSKRSGMFVKVK